MLQHTADGLRQEVRGPVLQRDDDGYDEARRVWNAVHDRHPLLVVQAENDADVMATVNYARENGLELAVR